MNWTCSVCHRPHNSQPDTRAGLCFPTYQWASEAGFRVQKGRWLPLVPREVPRSKTRGKSGKATLPGLFDRLPAFDDEPEFSNRREDWEA